MSGRRRRAGSVLLLAAVTMLSVLLTGTPGSAAEPQDSLRVVRVDTSHKPDVILNVDVPAETPLTPTSTRAQQRSFRVMSGAAELPSSASWVDPAGLRLFLLLDTDVPRKDLAAEQGAARELLLQMPSSARVTLMATGQRAAESSASDALHTLADVVVSSGAPFASQTQGALDTLTRQPPGTRRVLAILGRGWSRSQISDAAGPVMGVTDLTAQDVTVHSITLAGGDDSGPRSLADATGGISAAVGAGGLLKPVDRISEDIGSRYMLQFRLPGQSLLPVRVSMVPSESAGAVDVDLARGTPRVVPSLAGGGRTEPGIGARVRNWLQVRHSAWLLVPALLGLAGSLAYVLRRGRSRGRGFGGRWPDPVRRTLAAVVALTSVTAALAAVGLLPSRRTPWLDGSTHGRWHAVFDGYGSTSGTDDGVLLTPGTPTSAGETHASLVTSTRSYADVVLNARVHVQAQLRSQPNPWEVGWVLWHYSSPTHFYALVLKPTGWELSKQDPAYPGGQHFLASGTDKRFAVDSWHTVGVVQVGPVITVSADGQTLTRYSDTSSPYLDGAIGLYSEDAKVAFAEVRVSAIASLRPLIAAGRTS